MQKNRIMVIGEKETFLVKVLVQKVKDAGIDCVFKDFNINAICNDWEGTDLVTIFMADGDRPGDDIIRFLVDRLTDEGKLMIPIGEKNDIAFIESHVPEDLIYKCFLRPVDNAEYVSTVADLFNKVEKGEFKKSILVVDDDASYLGLIREWLKDDYRVSMANSGLQAIKWLGKNKADLILLDHEMPVTTGPQVLEMLRSDEETKNIPVMFLTGKSDKESVMAVVSLKPEGYFLKTIDKKELLEKLSEFFILHK
ncbi:response regulator [Butyrivibrio proteoclasticus]|uniref:response regulator n=1 Tax=Butyrivibrio proteoclasticus TaxID=43305 RepID=UPI00047CACA5|nr:response regulator [Butyrivibrio proteoclasticus]